MRKLNNITIRTRDIIKTAKAFEEIGFELLDIEIKNTTAKFSRNIMSLCLVNIFDNNENIEAFVKAEYQEDEATVTEYRTLKLQGWDCSKIENWNLVRANKRYKYQD
tara:strand:- start:302 stop:622 length:321 start_codon:yes stop_codon:yes gene_type:complete